MKKTIEKDKRDKNQMFIATCPECGCKFIFDHTEIGINTTMLNLYEY